ncbi:zinc finger X-linked protein ZXDB-like [Trichechus manatus latirostris]|uniref:Zinc finger X-linked protein ZXDB-like n=1 Tax=Trichechus manatus latirostris TaxID=127582 RepID=A0A2Y9RFV5_TRIMA|nr:zinc finger X-linked protein ZXDB-like [Trichechus manatus latirostris]
MPQSQKRPSTFPASEGLSGSCAPLTVRAAKRQGLLRLFETEETGGSRGRRARAPNRRAGWVNCGELQKGPGRPASLEGQVGSARPRRPVLGAGPALDSTGWTHGPVRAPRAWGCSTPSAPAPAGVAYLDGGAGIRTAGCAGGRRARRRAQGGVRAPAGDGDAVRWAPPELEVHFLREEVVSALPFTPEEEHPQRGKALPSGSGSARRWPRCRAQGEVRPRPRATVALLTSASASCCSDTSARPGARATLRFPSQKLCLRCRGTPAAESSRPVLPFPGPGRVLPLRRATRSPSPEPRLRGSQEQRVPCAPGPHGTVGASNAAASWDCKGLTRGRPPPRPLHPKPRLCSGASQQQPRRWSPAGPGPGAGKPLCCKLSCGPSSSQRSLPPSWLTLLRSWEAWAFTCIHLRR